MAACGLDGEFVAGVGMAHHAEGASEHYPEDPQEHEHGERVIVQIAEQALLEEIGEGGGEKPRQDGGDR